MKISIIIPNYNGAQLLKNNIPFVLKSLKNYQNGEIIVIDDASTDNSLEILDSFQSEIIVIKNSKNIGFARSVNKAVQETKGEIVILLNSDVRPEEDFIQPLLDHFHDDTVFGVGCMDKSIEGERIIERGRGIGKWTKGFLLHSKGDMTKFKTLWASGGSSAFKKTLWKKLDGFNEVYHPFYWEDIDLSYRAWKTGLQVLFEPKSVVIHEHDSGAIKRQFSSQFIKTTAYKNQFIFVWLNIRDIDLLASHFIWLPYHFLVALKNFDLAFFLGFFSALLSIPKIIQFIFNSKAKFVKKDKEIISLFTT